MRRHRTKKREKRDAYSIGHDFSELTGVVEGGLGDLGSVVEVVLKDNCYVFLGG
jgi:hypothetical protein